jgi:hypothetical protein
MERSIVRLLTKPSMVYAGATAMSAATLVRAGFFAGAELSEFLYAPIGSENNGMTLSVHSALTRLNRDQLCEFPKHAAAAGLCSLSGRLPAFSWAHWVA